jgi:hypothetical protein
VVPDIGQNARLKRARYFIEGHSDEAGGIAAVFGQVGGELIDRR